MGFVFVARHIVILFIVVFVIIVIINWSLRTPTTAAVGAPPPSFRLESAAVW